MPALLHSPAQPQLAPRAAAGLPIWPGLITISDVLDKGYIDHAIRLASPVARVGWLLLLWVGRRPALGIPCMPRRRPAEDLFNAGVPRRTPLGIPPPGRFTAGSLRSAYQYPATHLTDGSNPAGPWMGMRARLRPSFNCGLLQTAAARVICRALKKTGMILADGGSSWFLTGACARPLPAALWHGCLQRARSCSA